MSTAIACAPDGDICLDKTDDKCKLVGWNYTKDHPNLYPTILGIEKNTLECLHAGETTT